MKILKLLAIIISLFVLNSNSYAGEKKINWDFGLAFGSYGGKNYTEYNLGINIFFYPWVSIRNSGYFRASENTESLYGLDSTLRGHLNLDITEASSFISHAGSGIRFSNKGKTTPILELSTGIKATHMIISGGIKYILHKTVQDDAKNEMIYLITVSI